MKWDEAQTERLKSLWLDGFSASEIAAKFGLTKGQISGRAYRMGLSEKDKKVDSSSAQTLWQERKERRFKLQMARVRKSRRTVVKKPKPPRPETVECVGIAFPELKSGHCRYIPGDVRGVETLYCGNSVHGDGSYCAYHFHLCYQTAPVKTKSPSLVPV